MYEGYPVETLQGPSLSRVIGGSWYEWGTPQGLSICVHIRVLWSQCCGTWSTLGGLGDSWELPHNGERWRGWGWGWWGVGGQAVW